MKDTTKLAIRMSEVRERLASISNTEEVTEELRSEARELRTEMGDLETRHQAALAAEPEERVEVRDTIVMDSEMRERLELRKKATLTGFIVARMNGLHITGAEAEYSAAEQAEGDIPVSLFEPDPREVRTEERVVTSAPGTVGVNIAPIQPAIFAPSISQYMGIDMPQVPSGTFSQARINASASAASRAKGADVAITAQTFATGTATPKGVSAGVEFLAEDVLSAGVANFEASITQNAQMALSAELDDMLINGSGSGNDIRGLFEALTDPSADGTTLTFAHGLEKLAALTDGLWAVDVSQVRQTVGVDTYRLAAGLTSGSAANRGEVTLASWLARESGGFRTNSRMPATVSTKQQALAFRSGVSGVRTAVSPHWGRISITDIYSGAKSAMTTVVFHVFLGDVLVVQPGAYAQVEYKVS